MNGTVLADARLCSTRSCKELGAYFSPILDEYMLTLRSYHVLI